MTEQQTFVSTTSQLSGAQLATCVSCLPGVQWGVPGLGTVAGVVLGDVGGGSGVATLGSDPADSLLLVHTLGVIFQLLLLLEYGVLGPPLDAVDVEAGVAGAAAPDGVGPLHRRNTNQTNRRLDRVFQQLFSITEKLIFSSSSTITFVRPIIRITEETNFLVL